MMIGLMKAGAGVEDVAPHCIRWLWLRLRLRLWLRLRLRLMLRLRLRLRVRVAPGSGKARHSSLQVKKGNVVENARLMMKH